MTFPIPVAKLFAVLLVCNAAASAGSIPAQDTRNTIVPDGNTHHKMPAFSNRESWEARASVLRKQILSSAGLLPLPEKTALHPRIFGRLERDGYSVEKVLLETYPGFYLGGNLYRPLRKRGPFPGIVSPHGHWEHGRLENTSLVSIPARCINLARQGFVIFSYDMVGYNDTNQISHGDKGPRMGGPREDLWSINTMGLQLWDSIRSLDFVASLADVDPSRLSVTGASGGGTQAFQLAAVDERIKVAAPVNMLSFIHQGGGCQEAANLRVDANNVMFGAMTAPRPLLMVSATGDWTRNTPREEFSAIRSIYRLFDAERNLEQVQIDAPHNFNQASREVVYSFLNHRVLDLHGPVKEQPYRAEQRQDLLALFGQSRPDDAIDIAKYVDRKMKDARAENDRLRPTNAGLLAAARKAFEEKLTYSMLAFPPQPGTVLAERVSKGFEEEHLLLGRDGKGDRIPAVWLGKEHANPEVAPALIVHPGGAAPILSSFQSRGSLVRSIVDGGGTVLLIDAFQTGSAKAPRDTGKKDFTVYNRTNDANRVQDILTAIVYLQGRTKRAEVTLIGLGDAGVWAYFARALAGPAISLAADMNHFRTDSDDAFLTKFFIPGIRKAGDFRGAAVMNTQGRVLISNADSSFPSDWIRESALLSGVPAELDGTDVPDSRLAAWALEDRNRTRESR